MWLLHKKNTFLNSPVNCKPCKSQWLDAVKLISQHHTSNGCLLIHVDPWCALCQTTRIATLPLCKGTLCQDPKPINWHDKKGFPSFLVPVLCFSMGSCGMHSHGVWPAACLCPLYPLYHTLIHITLPTTSFLPPSLHSTLLFSSSYDQQSGETGLGETILRGDDHGLHNPLAWENMPLALQEKFPHWKESSQHHRQSLPSGGVCVWVGVLCVSVCVCVCVVCVVCVCVLCVCVCCVYVCVCVVCICVCVVCICVCVLCVSVCICVCVVCVLCVCVCSVHVCMCGVYCVRVCIVCLCSVCVVCVCSVFVCVVCCVCVCVCVCVVCVVCVCGMCGVCVCMCVCCSLCVVAQKQN